jgi:hypothetical protein
MYRLTLAKIGADQQVHGQVMWDSPYSLRRERVIVRYPVLCTTTSRRPRILTDPCVVDLHTEDRQKGVKEIKRNGQELNTIYRDLTSTYTKIRLPLQVSPVALDKPTNAWWLSISTLRIGIFYYNSVRNRFQEQHGQNGNFEWLSRYRWSAVWDIEILLLLNLSQ